MYSMVFEVAESIPGLFFIYYFWHSESQIWRCHTHFRHKNLTRLCKILFFAYYMPMGCPNWLFPCPIIRSLSFLHGITEIFLPSQLTFLLCYTRYYMCMRRTINFSIQLILYIQFTYLCYLCIVAMSLI